MNSLIISGSPRAQGKTAHLSRALAGTYQGDPSVSLTHFSVAEHHVAGCTGCEACKADYRCVINDDMQDLYILLDEADELVLVSPVFFAGPPAQMKAVLDRMQPYYWRSVAEGSVDKRPARLFVLGEGGDPHGFSPLLVSIRSALASAGFSLECLYDCVGLGEEELDAVALDPTSRVLDFRGISAFPDRTDAEKRLGRHPAAPAPNRSDAHA